MKTKIYFLHPNAEKINGDPRGWAAPYANAYLEGHFPIGGAKCVDAFQQTIEYGFFEYVGEIDADDPRDAWERLQNIDSGHELHDRSMDCGDVAVSEDGQGIMVEQLGFSVLSPEQVETMKYVTKGGGK